jgi:hypothetical protein
VRTVDLDQRLKKVANRVFEIGFENGLKIGRMGKAGRRGARTIGFEDEPNHTLTRTPPAD